METVVFWSLINHQTTSKTWIQLCFLMKKKKKKTPVKRLGENITLV